MNHALPLKILSAGSTVYGVRAALAAGAISGPIEIATDHGHEIYQAALAETCDADIIIIPAGMLDVLETKALLAAGSSRAIGTAGIGSAMRAGHPQISILDAASLVHAVRTAARIYLTTAPTGAHMHSCLNALGLQDCLAGKVQKFERATEMLAALSVDPAECLAFGPTTELLAWRDLGVAYGGVLPAEYDVPLAYRAGVLRRSAAPERALDRLNELTGRSGLLHFWNSGVIEGI